ncbi:hypothetical protein [Bacillus velezensis]|uniref:hypothetical protein n=1 Tax=Bacillus velezensis TaxID=492670 RepID=UPI0020B153BC|nr:hypothetical protein [Bacillus velezensis]
MAETKKYVRILKAPCRSIWYADKIGSIFPSLGTWENAYKVDSPDRALYIRKEDVELIVTEKRPAKVGERVLLTAPTNTKGKHRVGDVFTVREFGETGVHVTEDEFMTLWHKEYEVIVNNANKNEEADGMESVNQTAIDSASTVFEKVGEDYIGSKSRFGDILIGAPYSEAFVKAYANERKDVLVIPQTIEYTAFLHNEEMKKVAKSEQEAIKDRAQARRDEIVEQAKADVEGLREHGFYHTGIDSSKGNETYQVKVYYVEFIVDSKERKVTALVRRLNDKTPRHVGRAQAAPNDCFNVHIGKAIALRRALGLAVPDEYLNAPHPTEVRVGDVVQYSKRCATVVSGRPNGFSETKLTTATVAAIRIIDDSREEVSE